MHYSLGHSPASLNKWASVMARKLSQKYAKLNRYPVLTYRGMSGIATATALAGAFSRLRNVPVFAMLYCRKYDEVTNGNMLFEYTLLDNDGMVGMYGMEPDFVFVDDFVCSGETMGECARIYRFVVDNDFMMTNKHFVVLSGSSGDWASNSDSRTHKYMSPVKVNNPTSVGLLFSVARVNTYLNLTNKRKLSKRTSFKKLIRC